MGMRRRRRRRRMVAVGAVAHHRRVRNEEREADAYNQGLDDGYDSEPPPETTYAPPPPDPADEIEHLAQLHDSGVLTDDEFASAKAKVLGL